MAVSSKGAHCRKALPYRLALMTLIAMQAVPHSTSQTEPVPNRRHRGMQHILCNVNSAVSTPAEEGGCAPIADN